MIRTNRKLSAVVMACTVLMVTLAPAVTNAQVSVTPSTGFFPTVTETGTGATLVEARQDAIDKIKQDYFIAGAWVTASGCSDVGATLCWADVSAIGVPKP